MMRMADMSPETLLGCLDAAREAARLGAAVLEEWRPRSVGFYLYYPSRRQMPAALQALIDTLKAQVSARRADAAAPPRSTRR